MKAGNIFWPKSQKGDLMVMGGEGKNLILGSNARSGVKINAAGGLAIDPTGAVGSGKEAYTDTLYVKGTMRVTKPANFLASVSVQSLASTGTATVGGLTSSGNVFVNNGQFHIQNSDGKIVYAKLTGTSKGSALQFRSAGLSSVESTQSSMYVFSGKGHALSLGSNGNQGVMTLSTAENVGVGTASPTTKLHVAGSFQAHDSTVNGALTVSKGLKVTGTVNVNGDLLVCKPTTGSHCTPSSVAASMTTHESRLLHLERENAELRKTLTSLMALTQQSLEN